MLGVGERLGDFEVIGTLALSDKDQRTWSYTVECAACGGRWRVPHENILSNEVCSWCAAVEAPEPPLVKAVYAAHVEACMKYGVRPQEWKSFSDELKRDGYVVMR